MRKTSLVLGSAALLAVSFIPEKGREMWGKLGETVGLTSGKVEQVVEVPETYTVQKGDNLLAIVERLYGYDELGSAEAKVLAPLFGLENPHLIIEGNILNLPRPEEVKRALREREKSLGWD